MMNPECPLHETVLKKELVEILNLHEGQVAVDCTAGGGGHTDELLRKVGKTGKVVAIDRDDFAISVLKKKFEAEVASGNLVLVKEKFSNVDKVINNLGFAGEANGICADLGVSQFQLGVAERGFSFSLDGPLDMRMDSSMQVSAKEIVNTYSRQELQRIVSEYGEDPKARFIAMGIVAARSKKPIETTAELAKIVSESIKYRKKSEKNPATRTFMALRMAVNNEVEELQRFLDNSFSLLKTGGRLAVISFHSIEDRKVKQKFQRLAGKQRDEFDATLARLPLTEKELMEKRKAAAQIIKPFPGYPSKDELNSNPKSRSAKLRAIEKIN